MKSFAPFLTNPGLLKIIYTSFLFPSKPLIKSLLASVPEGPRAVIPQSRAETLCLGSDWSLRRKLEAAHLSEEPSRRYP
jgi:hypothetical protein